MSRVTEYTTDPPTKPASEREAALLERTFVEATEHTSGGSYDMIAKWVKGSQHVAGRNRLNRSASTVSDIYNDFNGVHSELDLYRQVDMRGGKVYIAGAQKNGRMKMPNTMPCCYCLAILVESGVRAAVFYQDDKPVRMRLDRNLLDMTTGSSRRIGDI